MLTFNVYIGYSQLFYYYNNKIKARIFSKIAFTVQMHIPTTMLASHLHDNFWEYSGFYFMIEAFSSTY